MEDVFLNVYYEYVVLGRKKMIGDYIEIWFSVDRGLLYRYYYLIKVSDIKYYK